MDVCCPRLQRLRKIKLKDLVILHLALSSGNNEVYIPLANSPGCDSLLQNGVGIRNIVMMQSIPDHSK